MQITFDGATKALAVASAAIAVFAAWKSLPLDAELKTLQTKTQKLDLDLKLTESRLKEAEAKLKETESGRKLSLDLYQEVRKILERKDKTPKDEEALRVLIESLAEDPFRYKLLSVLAVSASTPEVKRSASESSAFFLDESLGVQRTNPALGQGREGVGRSAIGNMDVDIFFCAAKRASSESIANEVIALKQPSESGRWRLRLLPESVNQQPGYGIASNEVRYNPPEETEAARTIVERMNKMGLKVLLRESQQQTKWYVSVFVCQ